MASLNKIKVLKEHKRQSAETALQRAKKSLQELTDACVFAKEEAANYKAWRIEEEQTQYQRVENKILCVAQLDELREHISALHGKETELQQAALTLENKCDAAAKHQDRCQQDLRQAEKNVEKYHLLTQEALTEALLIQQRHAEDLLDEFASAMKGASQHANTSH